MKLNKNNLATFFIIFTCIFLNACDASKTKIDNNKYLKVQNIDSTFFKDYVFISLKRNDNENRYLLSRKINSKDTINTLNYEKMKVGNIYKLELYRIDSSIVVVQDPKSSHIKGLVDENKKIIWTNDTFKTKIYMSNDVIDSYVRIK